MSVTTVQGREHTVYAAGAVLWREVSGEPHVLVIHRERNDDYSLPKGKVDPGESLPETAFREVWEETGYRAPLGAPLGMIAYDLPNGRPKEVHYWCAEVSDEAFAAHSFVANEEVDRLDWLPLAEAQRILTYERDRELLGSFADRFANGTARTFAVIALRHAKAVPSISWPGSDDSRPLTSRGQSQAVDGVPILSAFAPEAVVTSTAVRCRETIAPLTASLGIAPVTENSISQSAYDDGGDGLPEVIARVIASGATTVLCSHSPVIPEIARELASLTNTPYAEIARYAMLSTGECAVFHVASAKPDAGIIATETFGPLS